MKIQIKMNQLLPLAILIKMADEGKEIAIISVSFGFEDRHKDHIPIWRASMLIRSEFIQASQADSLELACTNLIELCQSNGLKIPTATLDDVIINHKIDFELINKLQTLLIGKDDFLLIFFEYWPELVSAETGWRAGIRSASHWVSGYEAEVRGSSLSNVCTKLVKQLESV